MKPVARRRGGLVRHPLPRLGWRSSSRIPHWAVYARGRCRLLAACAAGCGRGPPLYAAQVAIAIRGLAAALRGRRHEPVVFAAAAAPCSASLTLRALARAPLFEQPRPRAARALRRVGARDGRLGRHRRRVRARVRRGRRLVRARGAARGPPARARAELESAARRRDARRRRATSPRPTARSELPRGGRGSRDRDAREQRGRRRRRAASTSRTPERLARAWWQLNCAAPVALTRALLPRDARARPRRGDLHSARSAGCQPLPLHALYAATKAFDNLLGEALWAELRGTRRRRARRCSRARPRPSSRRSRGELAAPGRVRRARWCATALDALGRQPSVISGWFNWLRANAAMRLMPRSVLALAAKQVFEKWVPEALR